MKGFLGKGIVELTSWNAYLRFENNYLFKKLFSKTLESLRYGPLTSKAKISY